MSAPLARHNGVRIVGAIVAYGILSWTAAWFYQTMQTALPENSPLRPSIFALAGPALCLYTHMGYVLYGFASLFILPWIVAISVGKSHKLVFGMIALLTWVIVGALFADLF